MPRIANVSAMPAGFSYSQDEVLKYIYKLFAGFVNSRELEKIFKASLVEKRHFILPIEKILKLGDFSGRNNIFFEAGMPLVVSACREALIGFPVDKVGFIIFVSTTGFIVPSMETYLIQKLELPRSVCRIPVFGWGCSGGVYGIAIANKLLKAEPEKYALLVNLELCSLAHQESSEFKKNAIASAIFNDGATCVLVAGDGCGHKDAPSIVSSKSHLFDNTKHLMGWKQVDKGLEVILSPEIPSFIAQEAKPFIEELLGGFKLNDIGRIICHSGGAKIVEILQASCQISDSQLKYTKNTLINYGNMSSCSVIFALKEAFNERETQKGKSLLLAFGPGFSAEGLLIKW